MERHRSSYTLRIPPLRSHLNKTEKSKQNRSAALVISGSSSEPMLPAGRRVLLVVVLAVDRISAHNLRGARAVGVSKGGQALLAAFGSSASPAHMARRAHLAPLAPNHSGAVARRAPLGTRLGAARMTFSKHLQLKFPALRRWGALFSPFLDAFLVSEKDLPYPSFEQPAEVTVSAVSVRRARSDEVNPC